MVRNRSGITIAVMLRFWSATNACWRMAILREQNSSVFPAEDVAWRRIVKIVGARRMSEMPSPTVVSRGASREEKKPIVLLRAATASLSASCRMCHRWSSCPKNT